MAPPALIPVPSEAGCMYTLEAPWAAFIAYCRVVPFRSTWIMLRRAASIAFWMAAGTSRELTTAETDATLTITNHGQRGESEDTATLNGLGNAVNLYQLLDIAFVALLVVICHNLELQPAFTSSISQRLDAAVVLEARTVECNLSYTSGFRALGNQLTNFLGRVDIASGAVTQCFVQGRGAGQNLAAVGRNDLGIDVLRRAIHAETHGFELVHFQACFASATQSSNFFVGHLLCPTSSWLLYGGRLRQRNEHLCPYKVKDDGSHESPQRPDQPVVCRHP